MKAGCLIKIETYSDSRGHARKAAWPALFGQLD
jgi:hypothetical protein